MKKIICSVCLLLLLLCAAPLALAADDAAVFSVTVPSTLPVAVGTDGGVAVAADARIVNNSAGDVRLDAVSVVPQNSWRLDAWGTDYSTVKVNSKQFSMQFGGASVPASGSVDVSGCDAVRAGGSMVLDYDVRLAAQTANLRETIARVVFTVSWDVHGPLTGITVTAAPATTTYEAGDAFDSTGMVIAAAYADGTAATVTGWTVTDGAALAEGQASVTISYTEGGVTRTATVPVTVNSAASSGPYALLYDDGSLVFQADDTPDPEKTLYRLCSGFETTAYSTASDVPWYVVSSVGFIKSVSFETVVSPISTAYWFHNLTGTSSISGLDKLDTSNVTDMRYMFCHCLYVTTLDVSGFDTSKVTNMDSMFAECYALTGLDVSGFDTRNVVNMSRLFYGCKLVPVLDVSGFNTAKVTDMQYMFAECNTITTLNLSGFNTASVANMSYMFNNCKALTALDLSGFDTNNVTSMQYMFGSCSALASLDLEHFNTSGVTKMSYMFSGCAALASLDVSMFDTSGITNMSYMFSGCAALTTLDLSGFDTGGVTTMQSMFNDCSGLTSLTIPFDTSNVTSMYRMFRAVSSLKKLDLSSFETGKLTNTQQMFSDCKSLKTIYVSTGFNNSTITSSSKMFSDCNSLVGGNGTKYNKSNVTATYARIDKSGSPGYFTAKSGVKSTADANIDGVDALLLIPAPESPDETESPEAEAAGEESGAENTDEEISGEATDAPDVSEDAPQTEGEPPGGGAKE